MPLCDAGVFFSYRFSAKIIHQLFFFFTDGNVRLSRQYTATAPRLFETIAAVPRKIKATFEFRQKHNEVKHMSCNSRKISRYLRRLRLLQRHLRFF